MRCVLPFALAASLAIVGCQKPTEPAASAEAAAAGDTTEPTETAAQREERLRAQIDEAAELLARGTEADDRRALDLLAESTAALPDEAIGWYNLGIAQQRAGELAEAEAAFKRAADLDPELMAAQVNLAGVYVELGDLTRAMDIYRAGLERDREAMDLWVGSIALMRRSGRLDEAIAQAKEALKVNANSLDIYNNLGLVYLDRGELEMSQFIFQKAMNTISGGDSSALLHSNLGVVWLRQGKEVDARFEFERALELDPEQVEAMVFLSDYYLDNRNYQDTVDLLERAAALDPENPAIHLNLGIAYRGTERYDEARRAFERVLELRPDDPDPWLNLGILYGDYVKAYDEAIDAYNKYKAQGGDERALVDGYIEQTLKEQERVKKLEERKKRIEEERKKREEQKKLLEQQAAEAARAEAARAEQEAMRKAEEEVEAAARAAEEAAEEAEGSDEAPAGDGEPPGGEASPPAGDGGGEAADDENPWGG